jgi:hypothetical protein
MTHRTWAVIALLGLYKKGSAALGKIGFDVLIAKLDMGFSTGSLTNGRLNLNVSKEKVRYICLIISARTE